MLIQTAKLAEHQKVKKVVFLNPIEFNHYNDYTDELTVNKLIDKTESNARYYKKENICLKLSF